MHIAFPSCQLWPNAVHWSSTNTIVTVKRRVVWMIVEWVGSYPCIFIFHHWMLHSHRGIDDNISLTRDSDPPNTIASWRVQWTQILSFSTSVNNTRAILFAKRVSKVILGQFSSSSMNRPTITANQSSHEPESHWQPDPYPRWSQHKWPKSITTIVCAMNWWIDELDQECRSCCATHTATLAGLHTSSSCPYNTCISIRFTGWLFFSLRSRDHTITVVSFDPVTKISSVSLMAKHVTISGRVY